MFGRVFKNVAMIIGIFAVLGFGSIQYYQFAWKAPGEYPEYYRTIQPELRPYVDQYERLLRLNKLDPGVTTLTHVAIIDYIPIEGVAGLCHPDLRLVLIDQKVWKMLDVWERRLLVFHELTHCTQKMEHTEKMLGQCVPIMFPQMPPTELIKPCWKEMQKDLIRSIRKAHQ